MSNAQKVSDERLDAVALAITKQIESVFYHDQPGGAVQTRAKVQVIIEDALRAAPTPDAHSEVGVKALEWEHQPQEGREHEWWKAQTPFGTALIRRISKMQKLDGYANCNWRVYFLSSDFRGNCYVTIEEAKAAAQADFAQRVQSCITAGAVKAEPVAITDDMVDRACRSFIGQWEGCQPEVQRDCRKDMHAALYAALASKPEGER